VDGHRFLDLGNFHGAIPAAAGQGWHYWGAREPIMSDDWVVFPTKGEYKFVVKAKSDQLDEADTKADVWAEFDVRLYTEKGIKKLAKTIVDVNNVKGQTDKEISLMTGKARADSKKGQDWAVIESAVAISEAGLKGQIGIWFTNDAWIPDPPPAKDRNLWIHSLSITPPGGLAVQPSGKLPTVWADLRR